MKFRSQPAGAEIARLIGGIAPAIRPTQKAKPHPGRDRVQISQASSSDRR
jgi:hypothetical protein